MSKQQPPPPPPLRAPRPAALFVSSTRQVPGGDMEKLIDRALLFIFRIMPLAATQTIDNEGLASNRPCHRPTTNPTNEAALLTLPYELGPMLFELGPMLFELGPMLFFFRSSLCRARLTTQRVSRPPTPNLPPGSRRGFDSLFGINQISVQDFLRPSPLVATNLRPVSHRN